MTHKDLLAYRQLVITEEQLYEQLMRMKTRIENPPIPRLTGMPRGTPKPHDDIIATYMDMETRYAGILADLNARQDLIEKKLAMLTERSANVLRARYIQGRTWGQVAEQQHADRSTVWRWHNDAVKELRKKEGESQ